MIKREGPGDRAHFFVFKLNFNIMGLIDEHVKFMMSDHDYIIFETNVPVKSEHYKPKVFLEMSLIEKHIRNKLKVPEGVLFKPTLNHHDFGDYYELRMEFEKDNPKHLRFVDKFKDELLVDTEVLYEDFLIQWEDISAIKSGQKKLNTDEKQQLLQSIKLLEDNGFIVMGEIEDVEENEPTEISPEELAKSYGEDDWILFIQEHGMDSIVPACCSAGCETEPDGYCCHGFPSILLKLGLI